MSVEKSQIDRTYLAVRRQLKAMSAEEYEIGIRNKEGKMLSRVWKEEDALKAVPWLKRQNASGSDIYVRPAGEKNQGILLVDDLNRKTLSRMKTEGYEPAAVVETSPQNFQAWVRLSHRQIEPNVATFISKGLAKRFEADPNSADWRHYGRLAGFTNRKPQHVTEQGTSPWVLSHDASGTVATKGELAISYAEKTIREQQKKADNQLRQRIQTASSYYKDSPNGDPVKIYQESMTALVERYGDKWKSENKGNNAGKIDYSTLDFMIVKELAKRGFSREQLEHTLEVASPDLATRKPGHETRYIQDTVKKVFSSPELQPLLKKNHSEPDRDR